MIRGVSLRVGANLLAFLAFSAGIIGLAVVTFASGIVFDDSYRVTATIPDAGGVLPRQQVTVMGRAVGTVDNAVLVEDGVRLTFSIQPQFPVPREAEVRIIRRSPIGEQAVDLVPVPTEGWQPIEHGGELEVASSTESPTVQTLLDNTVELFTKVSPENTATVVHELATALEGRSDVIRDLNEMSLDVGETILDGQDEFRRLLASSEPLLEELDDHADDIVSLFGNQADLSEVLAENRPNLERLLEDGPNLLGEAEALIVNIRPNAQCLVDDLIATNEMLLGPSTADGAPSRLYDSKLDEVQMAIDKHRFFFQLGLPLVIQPDPDTGMGWARVKFVMDHLGSGDRYPQRRPTPATRPGAACEADPWGVGVNAVRQPGTAERGLDPTSPGILYAPLVEGEGPDREGPGGSGTSDQPVTPVTGGGAAVLALAAISAALVVRRR